MGFIFAPNHTNKVLQLLLATAIIVQTGCFQMPDHLENASVNKQYSVSDEPTPSSNTKASPSATPQACDGTPPPANSIPLLQGDTVRTGWAFSPYSSNKIVAQNSPVCSHAVAMMYPTGGRTWDGFQFQTSSDDIVGAKKLSFDFYMSDAAPLAVSAVWLAATDVHQWLLNKGPDGTMVDTLTYPKGWSHWEFDIPSTTPDVYWILIEKQDPNLKPIMGIDNVILYK